MLYQFYNILVSSLKKDNNTIINLLRNVFVLYINHCYIHTWDKKLHARDNISLERLHNNNIAAIQHTSNKMKNIAIVSKLLIVDWNVLFRVYCISLNVLIGVAFATLHYVFKLNVYCNTKKLTLCSQFLENIRHL